MRTTKTKTKTRRRGEPAVPAGRTSSAQTTDSQSRSLTSVFRNDFEENGQTVLAALREKDPITWLNLCVQVIPKESEPHDHPLGRIGDDELAYLERILAERSSAGSEPGAV